MSTNPAKADNTMIAPTKIAKAFEFILCYLAAPII